MRKTLKTSKARVVKTTRWSLDEWRVILQKAAAARVTPSEYVRAKALNLPPMLMRWKAHSRGHKAA